jgi:hypothetical protein
MFPSRLLLGFDRVRGGERIGRIRTRGRDQDLA